MSIEVLKLQSDKKIKLVVFGDQHYGVSERSKILNKKLIKYTLENDDAYCVLMGDVLDQAIVGKFGVIGESFSLHDSLEEFKKDFRELARLGKIMGIVPGNHDTRLQEKSGSKFDPILSTINEWNDCFKTLIKYGNPALILHLSFNVSNLGNVSYIGLLHHGEGGGSTTGAIVNKSEKNKNIINNYDFSIQGHFHKFTHSTRCYSEYNIKTMSTVTKRQENFTVGSMVSDARYAREKRMEPTQPSGLLIEFTHPEKANQSERVKGISVKQIKPTVIYETTNMDTL